MREAMKVADLMTRKLVSIAPNDSVEVAVQLLRRRGIRHLLVLKQGRLVGIVSDRDIKRALDPARTRKKLLGIGGLYFLIEPILVREIMTPDPVTIGSDATPQAAAQTLVTERFGALPVVEDGKLVGIITETDLLRYFAQPAEPEQPVKAPRRKPPRDR
jgi:acetoin utilization protein AcuB